MPFCVLFVKCFVHSFSIASQIAVLWSGGGLLDVHLVQVAHVTETACLFGIEFLAGEDGPGTILAQSTLEFAQVFSAGGALPLFDTEKCILLVLSGLLGEDLLDISDLHNTGGTLF